MRVVRFPDFVKAVTPVAAVAILSGCGASSRPAGALASWEALPSAAITASLAGAAPPGFTATTSGPLTPADVPFSWRPGCPVPPRSLRRIKMSFIGFDGRAHAGSIIVNAAVTRPVIAVFRTLYRARFPIRRMQPVDAFRASDARSMAADNTSGFNCRYAVANGSPAWSMHAYGEAIDVNTVENPYFEPGHSVQPPAGAAFGDRSDHRPGMAYPGGTLVSAFASIGWGWGGYWTGADYQHFSANGH